MRRYDIDKSLETYNIKKNYIGKISTSKNYGDFKVLGCYDRYIDSSNNKVRFVVEFIDTGFQTIAFKNRIKSGQIRDYMKPFVCGIGYIGDCSYEIEPSKHMLYKHWRGMFERCYNKNCKEYRINGEVENRWHCFMNFIEDAENLLGYKEMIKNPKIKFAIDKDFIKEGNQLYSKSTCCFIPLRINNFIQNKSKNRIYKFEGINIYKGDKNPFYGRIKMGNKFKVRIGSKESPFEVHDIYWSKKLEVAHKYVEEDFPFICEELRQVIYDRVKLREQISLKELQRAVDNGYFKKEYGIDL